MNFTLKQAQDLVEAFGGDEETTMTVIEGKEGHSGPGLYVFATDYPEEGSTLLGEAEAVKHYPIGESGMDVGRRCACGGLMLNGSCEHEFKEI